MIKARVRDLPTPAIHGRGWCLDEPCKLGDTTEVVYDFIAEPVHAADYAINARSGQGLLCANGNLKHHAIIVNGAVDGAELKRLMDANKDTQTAIAGLLGLTPDKINKVIKGRRRLKVEEADKLRRYYGMATALDQGPALLPIIGLVSAGSWREAIENPKGHMPSPDRSLSRDAFVVIIEGDSMDLVASEGEGVIVDPRDTDLLPGRYYIIRNEDGETTFKQYRDNPARLEPCSSNAEHKPIIPGRDMFYVVGRARKKVSDL